MKIATLLFGTLAILAMGVPAQDYHLRKMQEQCNCSTGAKSDRDQKLCLEGMDTDGVTVIANVTTEKGCLCDTKGPCYWECDGQKIRKTQCD
jgi:hypothetical protein